MPATSPTVSAKAKSLIGPLPMTRVQSTTMSVVPEVRIVRLNVSLSDMLTVWRIGSSRKRATRSRMRSKTTMVSLIE